MLWPLAVYALAVMTLAVVMIGLSHFLGQRHAERATGEPYESGIAASGRARVRHRARFYLVAVFFVVFDLEAVFLLSWAVAARDVGMRGYAEIAVFIAVLLAALIYLWRDGALDWGPRTYEKGRAR